MHGEQKRSIQLHCSGHHNLHADLVEYIYNTHLNLIDDNSCDDLLDDTYQNSNMFV